MCTDVHKPAIMKVSDHQGASVRASQRNGGKQAPVGGDFMGLIR